MKTKAFTALITAALIGGFGNTLLASNPQDPWLFLSLRFLIAGIIVTWWIPQFKTLNRKLILASILEVASVITLVLALSTINVALATIVGALTPILSLLINKLTNHQPVTIKILIPITLGLTATILIATTNPPTPNTTTGTILIIASTILGLTGSTLNGWYGSHTSPWTRTALTNIIGAIALTPILIINLTDTQATHPTWNMIIPALLVAILSGIISKSLNLYALNTLPIPVVMQSSTLSLVTAVTTAAIFLNQPITVNTILGIIIGTLSIITLIWVMKNKKLN